MKYCTILAVPSLYFCQDVWHKLISGKEIECFLRSFGSRNILGLYIFFIYITIILPVVLYGCETWSLTRREERKLRVFENIVLRRIFGPTRDEVTREWRRLHNEELNDLYSSPSIVRVIKSRRMKWAGHVARICKERGCIWSCWGNRRERDHC